MTSPDFGASSEAMLTQQTQLKVNLPVALYEFLASKAQKFDMPIAGYIKHLILNDVKDVAYQRFLSLKPQKRRRE